MHKEGQSECLISENVECSKTAVHQAIVKFKICGSYVDTKRSGRPRKTTPRDDHLIQRVAVHSPTSSCKKIRSALLLKGTDVHCTTIGRRLVNEFGLKSHKPVEKPRLTEAMKAKRVIFANKSADWSEKQWVKVLFSDESTIQQFGTRKQKVHRAVGTRFEVRYTVATMKHPPSVMIWGAMSSNGTAGLFFLPKGTTMNGARYLEMLQEKLQLHMAPCHRSKIVSEFLKKKKIKTIDWPGNSPDLNPIENVCSLLKNKVADRQTTSTQEMETAIKLLWIHEITPEYCRNLVDSMPRRLQAVLNNRGGHTKY